ncbi:hypothetical protein E2R68_12130 [Psychromonas sp. RZ22]|uniref:hypothetical protein n=1 Tax=Psychromonas algarum TaxID=2555643 RepID=UPI001068B775|nr:hypothetical protein [Psychromonas sp. RZ22]TEW53560.1 hypothetical protein E2R68_12130 [Psychromonas sp. RZ22]
MKNKLLKLQPNCEYETAMYINRLGICNGKGINIKYIFIRNGKEFVEVMHFARMILNNLDSSKIDYICRNAKGDIQKAYSNLVDILKQQVHFEFLQGFSLDDIDIWADDVNDTSNPLFSGIMLFCEENWVYDKVEDFAK